MGRSRRRLRRLRRWFADVAQDRPGDAVPAAAKRDGDVSVITSTDPAKYPDPSVVAQKKYIPSTRRLIPGDPNATPPVPPKLVPYATSGLVLRGYRPLIRTLATELPPADGDYVFIDQSTRWAKSALLRTTGHLLDRERSAIGRIRRKPSPIGPKSAPRRRHRAGCAEATPVQRSTSATRPEMSTSSNPTGANWMQIVPNKNRRPRWSALPAMVRRSLRSGRDLRAGFGRHEGLGRWRRELRAGFLAYLRGDREAASCPSANR